MKFRLTDKDVAKRFVNELEKVQLDGLTTVELIIHKRKRSLNQNALWHKWIGIIAKDIGVGTEELKNDIKAKVLGFRKYYCNGELCKEPKSSSKTTVEEFSRLMMATEDLARQLDIVLPTKEYYGY